MQCADEGRNIPRQLVVLPFPASRRRYPGNLGLDRIDVVESRASMSRTKGGQTMTKELIKDLKLAASFVKSIETADHTINLEIQQLAQRIEHIALELSESRDNNNPSSL